MKQVLDKFFYKIITLKHYRVAIDDLKEKDFYEQYLRFIGFLLSTGLFDLEDYELSRKLNYFDIYLNKQYRLDKLDFFLNADLEEIKKWFINEYNYELAIEDNKNIKIVILGFDSFIEGNSELCWQEKIAII